MYVILILSVLILAMVFKFKSPKIKIKDLNVLYFETIIDVFYDKFQNSSCYKEDQERFSEYIGKNKHILYPLVIAQAREIKNMFGNKLSKSEFENVKKFWIALTWGPLINGFLFDIPLKTTLSDHLEELPFLYGLTDRQLDMVYSSLDIKSFE